MSRVSKLLLLAAFMATASSVSSAQSLTGNVGSANIATGERAAEVRVGLDDEHVARARLHYEQAFTEWYQLRAITSFRKRDGESWDYTGLTLENWFQWASEANDRSGFNGGFRLAYTFADEGPGEVAVRLSLTDRFADNWEWRANLIAGMETGDGRTTGAELESRLQVSRGMPVSFFGAKSFRVGGELFSKYGNTEDLLGFEQQAHQAGPIVKAEWGNGVYVQVGLRAGLTDGSDDLMTKFFIGREF